MRPSYADSYAIFKGYLMLLMLLMPLMKSPQAQEELSKPGPSWPPQAPVGFKAIELEKPRDTSRHQVDLERQHVLCHESDIRMYKI